jgi:flavin reductase (DIM6/NTAB) family NADH-FMN oxidoreductase RutF
MSNDASAKLVALETDQPIWDRFFTVAPLVVVGSREPSGKFDLAPKHLATPLSWENYFGFVCTPSHGTYQNIKREQEFTVSFPKPDQVVLTSLSASPRSDDHSKPSLQSLPTFPATSIDGVFLTDSYLFLECKLDRIVDGFGNNSLIAGRVVAAQISEAALRLNDKDDQDVLQESPLLAYLPPGRYASISQTFSFPFPKGFTRESQE